MSYDFYNKVKEEYLVRRGACIQLESDINSIQEESTIKKDYSIELENVLALLSSTSTNAREKAKNHLESLVTLALQFIHDDNCEFIIDLSQLRGAPSAEFYIKTEVNGVESIQSPLQACGGGYVDVISTVLRYAYIEAYNEPKINNAIFLDEPGKCVSENASVKFAEFIKKVGALFNKQVIMVTHSDALKQIADNSVNVDLVGKVSKITYGDEGIDEDVKSEIQK